MGVKLRVLFFINDSDVKNVERLDINEESESMKF
jgi:hypothetical protein